MLLGIIVPKERKKETKSENINAILQRKPNGQSHISMGTFLQIVTNESRKIANFSIFVSYM